MKYWIAAKLVSSLLRFFAKRKDNVLTKELADFIDQTLDKSKPTDLSSWKKINNGVLNNKN